MEREKIPTNREPNNQNDRMTGSVHGENPKVKGKAVPDRLAGEKIRCMPAA